MASHWVVILQDASGIEIVVVGIAIFIFGFILACLILIWFSAKVSGMTMVEFAKSTATRAAAAATVVAIDIRAHLGGTVSIAYQLTHSAFPTLSANSSSRLMSRIARPRCLPRFRRSPDAVT